MHGAVLLRNLKQTGAQPLRNSHSYFPVGAPCQYCTSSTEHRVKFLRGQRWRRHFFERVKLPRAKRHRKRWKRFANDFWQGPKSEMVMFTWSALYCICLSIYPSFSSYPVGGRHVTPCSSVHFVYMYGMLEHTCVNANAKLCNRSTCDMHDLHKIYILLPILMLQCSHTHTHIYIYIHVCVCIYRYTYMCLEQIWYKKTKFRTFPDIVTDTECHWAAIRLLQQDWWRPRPSCRACAERNLASD